MVHKYKKYSDEFKMQVVQEYLNGPLGCRLLAQKYNLPSKNYILTWKEQLIKKGLLKSEIAKKNFIKTNKSVCKKDSKTAYERQLEKENFELKAQLAYYQELKRLIDEDNKKK